jgi:hypothetical protein
LKRIANEKKENRLSVFQGSNNKKEKKKKNSGEDDFTARGIATLVINIRLSNFIFYFCVKTQPTAVVDRIKAGTLDMDYFCLGCHTEIMGPCMKHPLFSGSLLQSRMRR